MIRAFRRPRQTAATAVLALALAVPVLAPAAAGAEDAMGGCLPSSPALQKTNAKAKKQAKELLGDTSYAPVIRTYTPEPTSNKGYDGYETIVVKSPKGTAPVVGYFELKGREACSVVVTSAQVVLSKNAYVVKLKFPGEQGNPGKLKVVLVSR